jgi:hypothetical protein
MTSSKSSGCWPSEATLTIRDGLQQRQQKVGEQETGKVIHGKPQFVSVNAGASLGTERARPDSGVADENIEPPVVGSHRLRKLSRTGKGRKIGLIEGRRLVAEAANLVDERFRPRFVPPMDQHLGAIGGKPSRDVAAYAIGRAGDQYRFAVHLHVDSTSTLALTAPARRYRPT